MTLQELAPYLPYNTRCLWYNEDGSIDNYALSTVICDWFDGRTITNPKKVKPILHPLSDLTKEITVEGYNDGEPFVPINEISAFGLFAKMKPEYVRDSIESIKTWIGTAMTPYWIWTMLLQWHLDVFGLIEKGEAIDINTLP